MDQCNSEKCEVRDATISHLMPWQSAVYTRRGVNDVFTFSHVEHSTQEKRFARSLKVKDLALANSTARSANLETLQEATVLILVTGRWAQHVNLNTFTPTSGRCPAPRYSLYDHLDRLCSARGSSKQCSELTRDYRALQYHSTLCHYVSGDDHDWKLFSVIPMLSDIVILPRLLDPSRIKAVMTSFSRATRKCMRDSLIVAGTAKYRENTLVKTERNVLPWEMLEPQDQQLECRN